MSSRRVPQKAALERNHSGGTSSPDSEPLWTVPDVAEYLRLKPEAVRAMARREELPAVKVGKAWRFK
jgi:excisionase family DNA binding protein